MRISFVRHIFATFTYSRLQTAEDTWSRCGTDFNRSIQRFRRITFQNIQYLRTIEDHRDGFPHIHVLFQFPTASVRVENSKYFEDTFFRRSKTTWSHGHTDFQVPRNHGSSSISYILKYITKNSTSKTIWKKIYSAQPVVTGLNTSIQAQNVSVSEIHCAATKNTFKPTTSNVQPITKYGVKLCTWSRGFDFKPFFQIP